MNRIIIYLESIISGERNGFFPAVIKSGLLIISWIILVLVATRRWLYSIGILRIKHLPCKVISVGNVVVGGSGKTPAVIAIAKLLTKDDNIRIAVISRGYKSKTKGTAIVSDGNNIFLDSYQAGDEPYLIAQNLAGISVLIGKNRAKSALEAIKRWRTHIVILDDGFQYLKLACDVNIVTIDSTRPFGFNHVLPRGYLREPLSTLKKADIILLTRTDQCNNLNELKMMLGKIAPSIPIYESVHAPMSLIQADTNQILSIDALKGYKILAVCGIANHSSFIDTLKSLEPSEVFPMCFSDHHEYSFDDINSISQKAIENKSDMIITTEKDSSKLKEINVCPVLILKIELKLVGTSTDKFLELIKQKCDL